MTPRRLGGGGVSAVPSRSAVQWGGGVPCTGGLEGSREAMHPRAELRPAKEGSLLLTFTKVSLGQQQTRCGRGSSQGVIDSPPVRSAAQYVTSAGEWPGKWSFQIRSLGARTGFSFRTHLLRDPGRVRVLLGVSVSSFTPQPRCHPLPGHSWGRHHSHSLRSSFEVSFSTPIPQMGTLSLRDVKALGSARA